MWGIGGDLVWKELGKEIARKDLWGLGEEHADLQFRTSISVFSAVQIGPLGRSLAVGYTVSPPVSTISA